MKAYLIQEYSNVDNSWHSVQLSSSVNGIFLDEDHVKHIYSVFKNSSTNPDHLRLITCNLLILKAESGNYTADFSKITADKQLQNCY